MTFTNCSQCRKKMVTDVVSAHGGLKSEWFDSKEAAEYLRISAHSLLNLTSAGKIPFHKLGRRNRFKRSDLEKILEHNRMGPYGYQART